MSTTSGFFGRDPHSYNLEAEEESFAFSETSDGSGRPGINIVANAICFWLGQHGDSTIGVIADAFKMPPEAVLEAVDHHGYLFTCATQGPITGWLVGQDGE